jgi:Family of unknown function (DUF6527)
MMGYKGIGVYHAGLDGIEVPGDFGYRVDNGRWEIALYCPKYGTCRQKIHRAPAVADDPTGPVWEWDGRIETPTIKPSIGCDVSPRCGQHMVIIDGQVHGTIAKKP